MYLKKKRIPCEDNAEMRGLSAYGLHFCFRDLLNDSAGFSSGVGNSHENAGAVDSCGLF